MNKEWLENVHNVIGLALQGYNIECRRNGINEDWIDKSKVTGFNPELEYRIKPHTIKVNGFDVPKPESEAPLYRTKYFIPVTNSYEFCKVVTWDGSDYDNLLLDRGLVHLSDDNAIAHAKAMLGINPYKE